MSWRRRGAVLGVLLACAEPQATSTEITDVHVEDVSIDVALDAETPLDTATADMDVHETKTFSFLVVSRTAGYRHSSIEAGQEALIALGTAEGVTITLHPDTSSLDHDALSSHDGIVLLSTTGDFLDALEQSRLVEFVEKGGCLLAIHAATDAEYDFPAYRALIGAAFARHPAIQAADVVVANEHPATAGLPARFTRTDEWYDWQALPDDSGDRVVLLDVDEATYDGGGMGAVHPIAWVHRAGEGRVFYTGMGHTAASFQAEGGADERFLEHLRLGLRWLLAP